jgi:hypothetical protein
MALGHPAAGHQPEWSVDDQFGHVSLHLDSDRSPKVLPGTITVVAIHAKGRVRKKIRPFFWLNNYLTFFEKRSVFDSIIILREKLMNFLIFDLRKN